jgi:hypothetical protein
MELSIWLLLVVVVGLVLLAETANEMAVVERVACLPMLVALFYP